MFLKLCLAVVTIFLVHGESIRVKIPQEFVPGLLESTKKCVEKFGLPTDFLKKFASLEFEDTEPVRKYALCLGSSAGFLDNNGYYNSNYMGKVLGDHMGEMKAFIDECNQQKWSDENETALKTIQCFLLKSSVHFEL